MKLLINEHVIDYKPISSQLVHVKNTYTTFIAVYYIQVMDYS